MRNEFEIMERDEEGSNSVRMWIYEGDDQVCVELAQDGTVGLTADKARQLASGLVKLAALSSSISSIRGQRARVDEVWAEIRALAPEMIERDSAEPLFRAAIERVLTGDSTLLPSEASAPVRAKPQNLPPEPMPARTGSHV